MKNKIYYFGIACILLIIVGCLFKISHWPGAGVLLTIGMAVFVSGFLPVALVNSYKAENDKKLKTLYILFYIAFGIALVGAIFKVQHWPGSYMLMLIGVPLPFILFLPAYLLYIRKQSKVDYNQLLAVLFFFAYFSTITALLSVNISKDLVDDMVLATINTRENNKKLYAHASLLTDQALHHADSAQKATITTFKVKTDDLCNYIDTLESKLILAADKGNQNLLHTGTDINLFAVNGKDIRGVGGRLFFDFGAGEELKKKVKELRLFLLSYIKMDDMQKKFIDEVMLPDNLQFDFTTSRNLIYTLEYLSLLKKKVVLAQYEVAHIINSTKYQVPGTQNYESLNL
jgi:hypothetical protein